MVEASGLQALFQQQRVHLEYFFDSLDYSSAAVALQWVEACSGILFFTGVGKSGQIAQKISATFASFGVRSCFLPPSDALHGDIGLAATGDHCVLLSKSGESEELLSLLPTLHKKGVRTLAVTSYAESRLAKDCECSVFLPILKEICPFDLAPTTSTTAQLIFGDCLAVALMQKRGRSLEQFAQNHPAGWIGKKIALRVADLMFQKQQMPLAKAQDRLIDKLHELSSKQCGCLLVVDSSFKLLGIFTDGDLRRVIEKQGAKALDFCLQELMSPSPKITYKEVLAHEAMQTMQEDLSCPVSVLPVMEGNQVIGLLRMQDIIRAGLRRGSFA